MSGDKGRSSVAPICVGITIFFAVADAAGEEPKATAPTAKQILEQVQRIYTSCKTYRDRGRVKREPVSQTRPRDITFSTVFKRPDQFRFEFLEPGLRTARIGSVIWVQGNEVKTSLEIMTLQQQPRLDLAFAGAIGMYGFFAHRIPMLLMPDKEWQLPPPFDPESAVRIDD